MGETTLYQRLLSRDEQALVELIDLTTPWLLGVAEAMLRDRDEAEEVVQHAFTVAWNRIALMDPAAGGLMPWLLRITRNRAIDRLRARQRTRRKSERLGSLGGLSDSSVAATEPNEAARPGWHVHESVHTALQTLSAERLRIPLGTVKTRLRLAFDKLRVALAPLKDWVL
jgi:RNA polymerase sigma-70 factor (ECF subfamily)